MLRLLFALIAGAAFGRVALAGEIVGDSFVARHNGTLRISLADGRWALSDREGEGPTAIAALKHVAAINGSHPGCDVTSAPGMVASVGHEAVADLVRAGLRDGGVTPGPLTARTVAGKPVLHFATAFSSDGGGSRGDAYVLRGERDYIFVICSANVVAYSTARAAFDGLVGQLAY